MMMKIKGYHSEPCNFQKNVPVIAFTASRTHKKSLAPNEKAKFDKIWTNAGKGYDSNSGIFTAPRKRYYQITATTMSSSGKYFHSCIWKNDEKTVGVYPGLGHSTGTAHIVLKLKKDRVFVKNSQHRKVMYGDGSHRTMFSGFLISQ